LISEIKKGTETGIPTFYEIVSVDGTDATIEYLYQADDTGTETDGVELTHLAELVEYGDHVVMEPVSVL
jgi:hypothetical protein